MGAGVRGHLYLALHRLAGSRMPRYYREYLAMDRARTYPDPGEMLGGVLEHAVETVPHHRGRVSPSAIRADPFGALEEFPILTRNDIRAHGDRLLSTAGDRGKWRRNTSGGSTGEPVVLLQDKDHFDQTIAIRNVYSTWAGGDLGAPELYVWGSERDLLEGREDFGNRVGNRILRRTLLNAFMLTDDRMREIVEAMRSGPPALVIAYVQAAYEVARYAARHEMEIPPQRGVIATAGTMHGFMRERLEQTFGCPTLNRYGSREAGDIAGECSERSGLHVLPWACHIEVVGPDGAPAAPGEAGEILVTSFTNRAMPLIRYQIGDRAIVAEPDRVCPCGRRTQMLAGVTGRTVDLFLGEDGRMVDGEYFTHLLYFRDWVRRFQVVQTSPSTVVFRVVTDSAVPRRDREEIAQKTRSALGPGCEVTFETVDEIAPLPSGKLSYTLRDF